MTRKVGVKDMVPLKRIYSGKNNRKTKIDVKVDLTTRIRRVPVEGS